MVTENSVINKVTMLKKPSSSAKSIDSLKRLREIVDSDESSSDSSIGPKTHFKKRRNILISDEEDDQEEEKQSLENKQNSKSHQFLKRLFDPKSSKPPPSTSPGSKVTNTFLNDSFEEPDKVPAEPKTSNIKKPEPVNNQPKTISVTGEILNQRTTRLMDPPLNSKFVKKTKPISLPQPQSPPASGNKNEQTNSIPTSSKPMSPKPVKTLEIQSDSISTSTMSSNQEKTNAKQTNQDDNPLNPMDVEKKRILERARINPNLQGSKKSNAKAVEALKNLKCKETAELFSKIRVKKNNYNSDLDNLSQSVRVAKYENEMRIAIVKNREENGDKPKLSKSTDENKLLPQSKVSNLKEANKESKIKLLEPRPVNKETKDQTNLQRIVPNPVPQSIASNNRAEKTVLDHKISKTTSTNQSNDLLGNIMNEMNKANTAQYQVKPPAEISNQRYSIENFLFRIVRWPYSWLNEQGKL